MAANLTLNLQMDFPVGKSRLETMPNELLKMVIKSLAPEDALKGSSTKYRASYKKEVSKLLSLCLVSKSLEAHVRPVVYENVLICQSTDLILLLRTLIENHELGGYITKLELSTKFLRQDPDHESLNLGLLRKLGSDLGLTLPKEPGRMTSRQENDLRGNLYVKVLDKAPNVESATMTAPSWAVRGLSDRLLSAFGAWSIEKHTLVAKPPASLSQIPKQLKTLTIEGREKAEGLMEGLPGQISGIWSGGQDDESKLKEIIFMFDDTTWFDSFPGARWAPDGLRGQLASLTDLRLIFTSCRFSDIAIVCDSFPSLKMLRIVSDYARFYLNKGKTDATDGLSPGTTRLCLTHSIKKLKHLESLHLDIATVPGNRKLLGENDGLDLSSLSGLLVAEISFRLVVWNKVATGTDGRYDPSQFLPQSLEKLGIMARGYQSEAGDYLLKFLRGLDTACKHGFPRLRSVQYKHFTGSRSLQTVDPSNICVCASSPHEKYCTYAPPPHLTFAFLPWLPDEEVQVLRGMFRQRGIRFMKRTDKGSIVTTRNIRMGPRP